tara:strand:- start:34 stop:567 length:534 start_codon:yes stop_codon:yes gene_type:complete
MEFIELCQHLLSANELQPSLNQNLSLNLNILSSLILGYAILSILTKKSAFLLAFLLCVFLQGASAMLIVSESVVYLLVFVVYSYILQICLTSKSKTCCGIVLLASFVFYLESALFGLNGIYGTHQTLIYEMSEYISLFAHFFFICSFINIAKIRNSLRDFIGSIACVSRSIYSMLFC